MNYFSNFQCALALGLKLWALSLICPFHNKCLNWFILRPISNEKRR